MGCPHGRKIFKGDTPPSKNEIVPIQDGNHRPAFGRQPARDLGGQSNPEHALEDCTIKFESNSFRILLSAGYNSFQVFDAGEVSSLPSKSKSEGTKLCPNFLEY